MKDYSNFFLEPSNTAQKQYEALRTYYVEKSKPQVIAEQFHFTLAYFKKLRFQFTKNVQSSHQNELFFIIKKPGPKNRQTNTSIQEQVISFRKQNYSILDIKAALNAKDIFISLDTINSILSDAGFAKLQRRNRFERISLNTPMTIIPPITKKWVPCIEKFSTEKGIGPLLFLPLIEKLGIIDAIKKVGFPGTSIIDDISSILSFLALKLIGSQRSSHDVTWNMDRALGLFARLNVLPKNATLSSYSYRVTWEKNKRFLEELGKIFIDKKNAENEFNLDFKSIPHWGDKSILDKHWSGSRNKSMKSILSLIVQDPSNGFLSYTHGGIKRKEQNECIFEFVDFWKGSTGVTPKMLIFDSKFTSYKCLNTLNESPDNIKFLTLRRRGKNLNQSITNIPEDEWQTILLKNRKHQRIKTYEQKIKLRHYKEELRQIIVTDNGRKKPTFLITNDFVLSTKEIIKKYARRWLIEQEISEQIMFFHLNNPSSSIVVKVDFDLTLTLLAHNIYKMLSNKLPGFENCLVPTVYRNFIENGGEIEIDSTTVNIKLKKKTHLPILFELPWMKQITYSPWLGLNLKYSTVAVS